MAGQVVWYSHLLKNLSQFVVIHTVKGFGIVEKQESVTSKPDPVQLPRLIPTVQAPASTPPARAKAQMVETKVTYLGVQITHGSRRL